MKETMAPQERCTINHLQQTIDALSKAALREPIGIASYQRIAKCLLDNLGCDSVCVFYYDHPSRSIRHVGVAGFPPDFDADLRRRAGIVRNDEVGRRIFSATGPCIFYGFGKVELGSKPAVQSGTQSMVLLPVRLEGSQIAGISVNMTSDTTWSAEELDWYGVLAEYCALLMAFIRKTTLAEEGAQKARCEAYALIRGRLEAILADLADASAPPPQRIPADGAAPLISWRLTDRERDVLDLLSLGASNGEIAAQLGISLSTVKKHVNAILRKLNAANRTQAAAMWRER